MKIIAAILAFALMGAGLAHAEDTPVAPGLTIEEFDPDKFCNKDTGKCEIDLSQLVRIFDGNNFLFEAARHMHAENLKLRAIKGCGKLEVQPKSPGKPGERSS